MNKHHCYQTAEHMLGIKVSQHLFVMIVSESWNSALLC